MIMHFWDYAIREIYVQILAKFCVWPLAVAKVGASDVRWG